MKLEPEKFFLGVVDFFAIIMPGALLAYVALYGAPQSREMLLHVHFSTEQWMIFLFASYLLGHFAFLLGSLLDYVLYDPLRKLTYWGQIQQLADARTMSSHLMRSCGELLFGKDADAAVMQAQRIKARALHDLSAESSINAFQWSKAHLSKEHPAGLVTVQRFEADSKFFRSFIVVLAFLGVAYALRHTPGPVGLSVGLMVLAGWRYINLRFKATQQAYWHIITLEAAKDPSSAAPLRYVRDDGVTHAGGVVFRRTADGIKWLLILATAGGTERVLPKGHIESGEVPAQTAVREVKEETGCWARVVDRIGDDTQFGVNRVRFFLMEYEEAQQRPIQVRKPAAERRDPEWCPIKTAKRKASFPESRWLLDEAQKLLKERERAPAGAYPTPGSSPGIVAGAPDGTAGTRERGTPSYTARVASLRGRAG
jgi:8-oxo-dGTP pyrophosphatase MutT (NUDIX family)